MDAPSVHPNPRVALLGGCDQQKLRLEGTRGPHLITDTHSSTIHALPPNSQVPVGPGTLNTEDSCWSLGFSLMPPLEVVKWTLPGQFVLESSTQQILFRIQCQRKGCLLKEKLCFCLFNRKTDVKALFALLGVNF